MKRWFAIRHARWLINYISFAIWWDRVGKYWGAFPNPSDFEYLDGIWEGKW